MMIHSDWGRWLPKAIRSALPEGVAVWYLGCNGIALKGAAGTTLLIDPYLGTGDPPRTIRMIPVPFEPEAVTEAAAILVTHEHVDHLHGPSQGPILAGTGATLYGPRESISRARSRDWAEEYELADDQLRARPVGETFTVGEFTVHVEPAHDPDAVQPVTYVIEHEAGTLFHGGDSKPAEAFERLGRMYNIDLGVLAYGTVGLMPDRETGVPARTNWYNDERQLIEAAGALRLGRLLPSHWDMWKRLTADPATLSQHLQSYAYPEELEVVEIGDRVSIPPQNGAGPS